MRAFTHLEAVAAVAGKCELFIVIIHNMLFLLPRCRLIYVPQYISFLRQMWSGWYEMVLWGPQG